MAKRADDKSARAQERSTAEIVRAWIDRHPVVRDALAMDIVNLSGLTRRIMADTGLKQEEAVLVACRRYKAPDTAALEAGIRRVVAGAKLEMRTRVGIITAEAHWRLYNKLEEAMRSLRARGHALHLIQGSESITLITDEAVLDEIAQLIGKDQIVKRRAGLVELNLRSSEVVEDVPGILSFLASSLSARGINMVDVISCHKDNMFLIDQRDMFAAIEVLEGLSRA